MFVKTMDPCFGRFPSEAIRKPTQFPCAFVSKNSGTLKLDGVPLVFLYHHPKKETWTLKLPVSKRILLQKLVGVPFLWDFEGQTDGWQFPIFVITIILVYHFVLMGGGGNFAGPGFQSALDVQPAARVARAREARAAWRRPTGRWRSARALWGSRRTARRGLGAWGLGWGVTGGWGWGGWGGGWGWEGGELGLGCVRKGDTKELLKGRNRAIYRGVSLWESVIL